ncbi:MAG: cation transporter [Actinobacteria bacterium]|nr:cation transporter [Actinomycetota bacterium]
MSNQLKQLAVYLPEVHCADCARDLAESVLLNKPGIKKVSFNDKEFILNVSFDEEVIDENNIRKLISDSGLKIHENNPPSPPFVKGGMGGRLINLLIISVIVVFLIVFVWWTRNL